MWQCTARCTWVDTVRLSSGLQLKSGILKEVESIQARLRALRSDLGEGPPVDWARIDRVSVYAVATAHRLETPAERLLAIRIAAETDGLLNVPSEIATLAAADDRTKSILELCREFDSARIETGDVAAVRWLDTGARTRYEQDVVDALLAVQPLVQPLGT